MAPTTRSVPVAVVGLLVACSSPDSGSLNRGTDPKGTAGSTASSSGAGGQTNAAGSTGAIAGSGASAPVGGASAAGGAGGTGSVPTPVDCAGITQAGHDLCTSGTTTCEAVYEDSSGCNAVCAAAGLVCVTAFENVDGQCAADRSLPELPCDSGHASDYCVCGDPEGGNPGAGGSAGTGGSGGLGGSGGSSGSGGGGGGPLAGTIRITDPVPGFASVAGGTTGGGTNLASALTVSTMSALQSAASGSNSAIILVEPGTYGGTLTVGSNKTIIGTLPGVMISGNLRVAGSNISNVIVRNLAVRGLPCSTYDECRAGADAVYVGDGAHHVWLDHLDISDGQDGNCDVSQGGDYVTVSWSRFYYTYNKEHRFSNLIAGSDDEPASVGKLRITYMNSHWGERVDSRQPRGRFGNVHMLNNYHDTGGGQIHGVGFDMAMIAENSVYHENRSIWTDMGSPRGWRGIGNEGTASNMNASQGTVFTIPYTYEALPTSQVVAAVTSQSCGAGNTCTFAY